MRLPDELYAWCNRCFMVYLDDLPFALPVPCLACREKGISSYLLRHRQESDIDWARVKAHQPDLFVSGLDAPPAPVSPAAAAATAPPDLSAADPGGAHRNGRGS